MTLKCLSAQCCDAASRRGGDPRLSCSLILCLQALILMQLFYSCRVHGTYYLRWACTRSLRAPRSTYWAARSSATCASAAVPKSTMPTMSTATSRLLPLRRVQVRVAWTLRFVWSWVREQLNKLYLVHHHVQKIEMLCSSHLICFNFCYRFLAVAAPGKYLDIVALGTGPGTVYVDQVTLNGAPLAGATVEDGPLQQDAVLRFIMRGEWWCS